MLFRSVYDVICKSDVSSSFAVDDTDNEVGLAHTHQIVNTVQRWLSAYTFAEVKLDVVGDDVRGDYLGWIGTEGTLNKLAYNERICRSLDEGNNEVKEITHRDPVNTGQLSHEHGRGQSWLVHLPDTWSSQSRNQS